MKFKTILVTAALLTAASIQSFAQDVKQGKDLTKTPALYLGSTLGLNNAGGLLGLRADVKINNDVMLGGAVGIGTWGGKYSLVAYYLTKSNWNPMIGISKATGLDSLKVKDANLIDLTTGNKYKGDAALECKPVTLLNLGVEKQWFTKKRGHRFYVDLGYSVPLSGSDTYRVITPNVGLTKETKQAFDLISPGGIILAAGFCFRLF